MIDENRDRFVAHGLVQRGETYLLLRRRDGRYLGGQWDIPGGTVEPGETPAEAAVRECWEEAGLRATAGGELTHLENPDTNGRDLIFHTITFRLRVPDTEAEVRLCAEEHDDFGWLKPAEAQKLPLVWHVVQSLKAGRLQPSRGIGPAQRREKLPGGVISARAAGLRWRRVGRG